MSCSCVHQHSLDRHLLNAFFEYEEIYSCLNPENDAEDMKEWKKVDEKLKAHGIVAPLCWASIGAKFHTVWNKADDARKIISGMIRDGEVDAGKLQLTLLKAPTVDEATQVVARLWFRMPAKDAQTIVLERSLGASGLVACSCGHYYFQFYRLSGGCGLLIGVNGRWEDKESTNALIDSAAIYHVDGKVMRIPLKRKAD